MFVTRIDQLHINDKQINFVKQAEKEILRDGMTSLIK